MSFYRVKDLPESDRPREKLLKLGAENLTDAEIIAILLRTGIKGKNVIDLAREILIRFGGIEGISEASVRELSTFKGLGKAKAITLKAAIEAGRRAGKLKKKRKIDSPEAVVNLLEHLRYEKVETFGILTLNTKGELINIHTVSKGGVNFAHIEPKEVFHPAVKDLAVAVILFHNHPSGNPEPSTDDIKVTRKIVQGSEILDIEIIDHIIIGRDSFFSFKENHLI
ncbi:RadC family protein [Desulfurobacterium sp.]